MNREREIIAGLEIRGLAQLGRAIATAHGVTLEEMVGTSRMRPIVHARHAYILALRSKSDGRFSYPYLAEILWIDQHTVRDACLLAKTRARATERQRRRSA